MPEAVTALELLLQSGEGLQQGLPLLRFGMEQGVDLQLGFDEVEGWRQNIGYHILPLSHLIGCAPDRIKPEKADGDQCDNDHDPQNLTKKQGSVVNVLEHVASIRLRSWIA